LSTFYDKHLRWNVDLNLRSSAVSNYKGSFFAEISARIDSI